MTNWLATDESLFFKKDDKNDLRLGNFVRKDGAAEFFLHAYPDEEAILNGGGRAGAAGGPERIRHWLYRMTPSLFSDGVSIVDGGNINTALTLDQRHQAARKKVAETMRSSKLVTLGGGHDYGFSDGAGFLDVYKDQKPLVINFDAHLDVRPPGAKLSSGTPFYRLLEEFKGVDFIEIGIQTQCNAKSHYDWLQERGGKVVFTDLWLQSGENLIDYTLKNTGDWLLKRRPTFLSIDMDVFSWPYAIGTSQSWPVGLSPEHFYPLYLFLLKRLDVKLLGVYETAPALESHDGTAKLAAQLIHRFLF